MAKKLLAVVLVAGAVALWVGVGGGCDRGAKAKTKEALKYVPADAQIVLAINGDGLRDPFATSFMKKLEADPEYRALRKSCAVDPIRAANRFTLAIRDYDDDKTPEGVFVLQGDKVAELVACIEKEAPEFVRDGKFLTNKDADGVLTMTLANDDTLVGVFGASVSKATVEEVLKADGPNLADDKQFAELVSKIDTTDAMWFVARGKLLRELPSKYAPRSIAGSIQLGDEIDIRGVARFSDDADAKRALELLDREVVGDLKDVGKVDVSRDDADVSLKLTLSRANTKKLLGAMGAEW